MARSIQLLRIFLASPSDLDEERCAAAGVVDELNRTLAPQLGIHLELIRWETHAAPGFGADSQDVINQEIRDDYDIFVGVLYKRFGSKTLKAESGTEEEFSRAYSRFKKDPLSVQILFYFKTKEFFPTETDLAQMVKVVEFRKSLGSLGGLYWEFKEVTDFVAFLRIHLAKHLTAWRQRSELQPSRIELAATTVPKRVMVRRHEDDLEMNEVGLIELGEVVEEQMKPANDSAKRIELGLNQLSEKIRMTTEEMNALASQSKPEPLYVKSVVDRAAKTIDRFADMLDNEMGILSASFRAGLDTMSKGLSVFADFGGAGETMKVKAIEQLNALVVILSTTNVSLIGLREVINKLPRLTTALARAKARATGAMHRLSSEIDEIKSVTEEVIRSAT